MCETRVIALSPSEKAKMLADYLRGILVVLVAFALLQLSQKWYFGAGIDLLFVYRMHTGIPRNKDFLYNNIQQFMVYSGVRTVLQLVQIYLFFNGYIYTSDPFDHQVYFIHNFYLIGGTMLYGTLTASTRRLLLEFLRQYQNVIGARPAAPAGIQMARR